MRCCERADPAPSLPRPTRGTACPNREGPAGRREDPASLLPMLGAPAGRSPAPPAPPLADRAAALAAGGGPRAPLLPLLNSGGVKRRLHPPAAFPGQSRQRGPRARSDSGGSSLLASAEAAAAGGLSPARPDGFPKPRTLPQQGWDLPVRPGRRLQPGAPAEPRSPPPAAPFDDRRSRMRHRKQRWRPHRGREGAGSWTREEGNLARTPSFSLPRPLRVPAHYPAPQLVPGAVTSGPRSRAPPASRCSRLKRKESGRVAVTPSP